MASIFIILPVFLGFFDISFLAAFIAAAQEDNDSIALITEVYTKTGTIVNPKFVDSTTHGAAITRITGTKPVDSLKDFRSSIETNMGFFAETEILLRDESSK